MINTGGTEFTRFLASGMDQAVAPAVRIRTRWLRPKVRLCKSPSDKGLAVSGNILLKFI